MLDFEFKNLLVAQKTLNSSINWSVDEDHSDNREFLYPLENDQERILQIRGSYNRNIPALSFTILDKAVGRIYGLDLGRGHRNPDKKQVGPKHKHSWTELDKDGWAYVPSDITGNASDILQVWKEFCVEFNIVHNGDMFEPDWGLDIFKPTF